jgi:hypothetical protein
MKAMKTTVEIPDRLFREVKEYAARNGVPIRAVLEMGLRSVLEGPPPNRRRFRLKTVTTKGHGLASDADWSAIRSLIYEGHGG